MTEADVIKKMRAHLESQFPKVCNNCQRRYATLREYLRNTQHVGSAMPYDADAGNWLPLKPLGTVAYANCPCGSTLLLSSQGMPLHRYWSLLMWARVEAHTRKLTPQQLLNHLRDRICEQVLAEQDPGNSFETQVPRS